MQYEPKLIKATFLKRYKRFLADVILENEKDITTVFVPNTGSMKTCAPKNSKCYLSYNPNPKRKYAYTLELTSDENSFIGINTHLTNKIVLEALEKNTISQIKNIIEIRPEYKIKNSRFDFFIQTESEKILLEVKNVTLQENFISSFPDAITTRGQKHLEELAILSKQGYKCFMLYVVSRENSKYFRFASEIDSKYFKLAKQAKKAGVNFLCYECSINQNQNTISKALPINWESHG